MKFVSFISSAFAAITITSLSVTSAKAEAPAAFQTCVACHQATGAGIPGVFPPLAGSEWVTGPVENLIRIQLRGLMGPIKVAGKDYNSVMPPNASMTDEQIAEVLTYVRNEWGNKGSAVTPDMVKALRSEAGKPMLKVEDLIDPATAPAEKPAEDKPIELKSGEFNDVQEVDSSLPGWVFGFFGICLVPVAVSFVSKK